MRRIPRLRRPYGLFTSPVSGSPPWLPHQVSVSSTVRCISSTPSASLRPGDVGKSHSTPPRAPEPISASVSQSSALQSQPLYTPEDPQEVDETAEVPQYDEPTIPLPPRRRVWAPKPTDVDDPSYQPAETGTGLPEIKSTDDWFADDENWDEPSHFSGFAPAVDQRVQDLNVLEVLLRRAVVEALAVKHARGSKRNLAATWSVGGRVELVKTLSLEIANDKRGAPTVKGDSRALIKGLLGGNGDMDEPTEEWDDEVVDEKPADIETMATNKHVKGDNMAAPFIEAAEAANLCKEWDKSWRDVPLDDMGLKFAITKRIYQLTGHRIHDYKLHSILTVGGLLKVLQSKPKPAKLFDFLAEEKPEMATLPNVKFYPRRVTPIDKEKMVGRWKIIERELEKRGLPATGHEHLPKPNQRSWILGKA